MSRMNERMNESAVHVLHLIWNENEHIFWLAYLSRVPEDLKSDCIYQFPMDLDPNQS